jgi:dCTP deaminase
MMYSDQDILRAIDKGELVIEPFSRALIKSAGITLHLGAELLKPLPGKVVDIKNKIVPDMEEIQISEDEPYALKPGGFVLGHTFQSVTVGQNLGFLIEGRSTLARVGLTIVQTAMLVNPGHIGRPITLELANHGPNTILLYAKMKIAHAAVIELRTPSSERYDDAGKYRDQKSVGGPIFKNEFMEED